MVVNHSYVPVIEIGFIIFIAALIFIHREKVIKIVWELAGDFAFGGIITILVATTVRRLTYFDEAVILIIAMFSILIIRFYHAKSKNTQQSRPQQDVPKGFEGY